MKLLFWDYVRRHRLIAILGCLVSLAGAAAVYSEKGPASVNINVYWGAVFLSGNFMFSGWTPELRVLRILPLSTPVCRWFVWASFVLFIPVVTTATVLVIGVCGLLFGIIPAKALLNVPLYFGVSALVAGCVTLMRAVINHNAARASRRAPWGRTGFLGFATVTATIFCGGMAMMYPPVHWNSLSAIHILTIAVALVLNAILLRNLSWLLDPPVTDGQSESAEQPGAAQGPERFVHLGGFGLPWISSAGIAAVMCGAFALGMWAFDRLYGAGELFRTLMVSPLALFWCIVLSSAGALRWFMSIRTFRMLPMSTTRLTLGMASLPFLAACISVFILTLLILTKADRALMVPFAGIWVICLGSSFLFACGMLRFGPMFAASFGFAAVGFYACAAILQEIQHWNLSDPSRVLPVAVVVAVAAAGTGLWALRRFITRSSAVYHQKWLMPDGSPRRSWLSE